MSPIEEEQHNVAAHQGQSSVVAVSLATALSLMGDSMLYIALPVFWQQAGLDALWQVGVLLSINRLIRIPFNPLIGLLYRRISLKTGLLLAVALGVVSTCGYAVAQSFIAWLALRALWGVAWSLFRIGGLSAVVRCAADHDRGRTMGRYNGLYRLGSLVGMLLGGFLVGPWGLSALAWTFGLLSLAGLPLLALGFHLPPAPASEDRPARAAGAANIGTRGQWPVILTGLSIALLIQGVFASSISAVVARQFGDSPQLFGLAIGATALAGGLQALRWAWEPWLASRMGHWSDGPRGRLPWLVGSLILGALCLAPMTADLGMPLWLLTTLLVLLASTAMTTLGDALAADTARRVGAVRFMTRYSIAQDLGAASGPLLAYLLLALTGGFGWLYALGSGLLAALALYWARMQRQSGPSQARNNR